jgi:hypothetical protein
MHHNLLRCSDYGIIYVFTLFSLSFQIKDGFPFCCRKFVEALPPLKLLFVLYRPNLYCFLFGLEVIVLGIRLAGWQLVLCGGGYCSFFTETYCYFFSSRRQSYKRDYVLKKIKLVLKLLIVPYLN